MADDDPLIPKTKDNDDDDDGEESQKNPFSSPSGSFTPRRGYERLDMKTMQKEKSGMQKPDTSYDETSFGGRTVIPDSDEDLQIRLDKIRNFTSGLAASEKVDKFLKSLNEGEKENETKKIRYLLENGNEIEKIKEFIKKRYPEVNFGILGKDIRFATDEEAKEKTGIKITDVVIIGPRGGLTKILLDDGSGFQSKFLNLNFVKNALGKPAADLLVEENVKIKASKQALKDAQKEARMLEKTYSELVKAKQKEKDLQNKLEKEKARKEQLGSEPENRAELARSEQLIKNYESDLQNTKKETKALEKQMKDKEKKQTRVDQLSKIFADETEKRNTMEERLNSTKTLDELNEQKAELERRKEEYRTIINDENASPSEKEDAREGIAEIEEEEARLEQQVEERERAMPLRERVKEIFKKYGVTVTSILLAAGVTIGVVISTITNALKSMGKALGNGLKEIGKKTAAILPGLIGSIVSFLFKTAGQVVGFLAEHAWMLILAVVAFLVEGYAKKQR